MFLLSPSHILSSLPFSHLLFSSPPRFSRFVLSQPKLSWCCCLECDALSISIPLCSLHLNGCNLPRYARTRMHAHTHAYTHAYTHTRMHTYKHAHVHTYTHADTRTRLCDPIRFNISAARVRQPPCHRLLPGDTDPGSGRRVFGGQSADLEALLALCPALPRVAPPPSMTAS